MKTMAPMLNEIHNLPESALNSAFLGQRVVDSKRLQMFYISVREGSFSAAAQILSLSPSAISHAMKGLEEELGCALFRRLGPQVKPTGAAVRLMPMVEEVLSRMSAIKCELSALADRSESLVIRVPASLATLIDTATLATFSECFPAAHLEILLQVDGDEENRTADFEIDYVEQCGSDRIRRDLMKEDLSLYAAPFHNLGQQSKASLADVRQSLLVFPDRGAYDLGVRHFQGSGSLRTWILPGAVAARDLAVHGQVVALLPQWAVADCLAKGTLVKVRLPGLPLSRVCSACWAPTRPLTWVADVFLNLLAAAILTRLEPEA